MRVLIVEDDAIIAMHLAMLVAELGHEICGTAASAAAATQRAAQHEPDVVLMDIRLAHGSSGIEAARELHAHHSLRCIFISANLDETTKRALLQYDPIDFVGKPVLPLLLERAQRRRSER
jgi:two-component system, response regulator PdtaR